MVPSGAHISAIRKTSLTNNSVKHRLRPSRDTGVGEAAELLGSWQQSAQQNKHQQNSPDFDPGLWAQLLHDSDS